MFDVSFTELMVVGVVALIVIGPERLPKVAKTIGHLLGRAQRYVNDVKGDIRREIELDDLRKFKSEMDEAAQSVQSSLRDTETSLRSQGDQLRNVLDQTAQDARAGLGGDKPAAAALSKTVAPPASASAAAAASLSTGADTAPGAIATGTATAQPTHEAAAPYTVPLAAVQAPTVEAETPLSLPAAAFGTGDSPETSGTTDTPDGPTSSPAPASTPEPDAASVPDIATPVQAPVATSTPVGAPAATSAATPVTAPASVAKPARENDWPPPPTWNKP